MHFVANFTKNATVKEFSESVNICQSCELMYSCTVFTHWRVYWCKCNISYSVFTDVLGVGLSVHVMLMFLVFCCYNWHTHIKRKSALRNKRESIIWLT